MGPRHELVIFRIGESDKRQMISSKSLGSWKIFAGRFIFNIVKISGVVVPAKLTNNGRNTLANIVEIPLIILEKWMILNLLDTFVAQSSRSENNFNTSETTSQDFRPDTQIAFNLCPFYTQAHFKA